MPRPEHGETPVTVIVGSTRAMGRHGFDARWSLAGSARRGVNMTRAVAAMTVAFLLLSVPGVDAGAPLDTVQSQVASVIAIAMSSARRRSRPCSAVCAKGSWQPLRSRRGRGNRELTKGTLSPMMSSRAPAGPPEGIIATEAPEMPARATLPRRRAHRWAARGRAANVAQTRRGTTALPRATRTRPQRIP